MYDAIINLKEFAFHRRSEKIGFSLTDFILVTKYDSIDDVA